MIGTHDDIPYVIIQIMKYLYSRHNEKFLVAYKSLSLDKTYFTLPLQEFRVFPTPAFPRERPAVYAFLLLLLRFWFAIPIRRIAFQSSSSSLSSLSSLSHSLSPPPFPH